MVSECAYMSHINKSFNAFRLPYGNAKGVAPDP